MSNAEELLLQATRLLESAKSANNVANEGTEYVSFGRVQVGSDGQSRVSALTLTPDIIGQYGNKVAEAATNGPGSKPVELFPGFLVGYVSWRSKPRGKK